MIHVNCTRLGLHYSSPSTNHYNKNEIASSPSNLCFAVFVIQQGRVDSTKESMDALREGKGIREIGKERNQIP